MDALYAIVYDIRLLAEKRVSLKWEIAGAGSFLIKLFGVLAVFMIVVTNGSRFPGLGGLGVHGTGIAIRKLDMYVAAVVISPHMI
ncbi:hypothetical protein Ahy_B04g073643 [Arachis hypogaea]|uniref:Malic enzyme N-terminal domain-containing protein n=1 Tax=Arachis hypogaea TaxID=3818 RepID=A0A444ZQX9_ARAHY|nr:hypothetical protein Ahy_B04g073643 [Arachis hypogaea]